MLLIKRPKSLRSEKPLEASKSHQKIRLSNNLSRGLRHVLCASIRNPFSTESASVRAKLKSASRRGRKSTKRFLEQHLFGQWRIEEQKHRSSFSFGNRMKTIRRRRRSSRSFTHRVQELCGYAHFRAAYHLSVRSAS